MQFIFFFLLIFLFHGKLKGQFIIPGIFALEGIIHCIIQIYNLKQYGFSFTCALFFVIGILYILAAIAIWKGYDRTITLVLVILPCALISIDLIVFYIQNYADYMNVLDKYGAEWLLYDVLYITQTATKILCFFAAILIYYIKNKTPSCFAVKAKKDGKDNPEFLLKQLNDKREFGMISEEDYNALRTEIIGKI